MEVARREAELDDIEKTLRDQYAQQIQELIEDWGPHNVVRAHAQKGKQYTTQRGRLRAEVHNNLVRMAALTDKRAKVQAQLDRSPDSGWWRERLAVIQDQIDELNQRDQSARPELQEAERLVEQYQEIHDRLREKALILQRQTLKP